METQALKHLTIVIWWMAGGKLSSLQRARLQAPSLCPLIHGDPSQVLASLCPHPGPPYCTLFSSLKADLVKKLIPLIILCQKLCLCAKHSLCELKKKKKVEGPRRPKSPPGERHQTARLVKANVGLAAVSGSISICQLERKTSRSRSQRPPCELK